MKGVILLTNGNHRDPLPAVISVPRPDGQLALKTVSWEWVTHGETKEKRDICAVTSGNLWRSSSQRKRKSPKQFDPEVVRVAYH